MLSPLDVLSPSSPRTPRTASRALLSPGRASGEQMTTTVGMVLKMCVVDYVVQGSSAEESGLVHVGDRITHVDGFAVSDSNVSARMRGEVGSTAVVRLIKVDGTPCEVHLVRRRLWGNQQVHIESVIGKIRNSINGSSIDSPNSQVFCLFLSYPSTQIFRSFLPIANN